MMMSKEAKHTSHMAFCRNQMDQDLIGVIKEFASSGRYKTWTEVSLLA